MVEGKPNCARCLHPRDWHQHWRPGEECSRCTCIDYRRPRLGPAGWWLLIQAFVTEIRRR